MLFGAHVSIAGGVFNAPLNAASLGCEIFQMFTRSPRGGKAPELTSEIIKQFKENCITSSQQEWFVHTPYFINFASKSSRIYNGSISVVRQELERASALDAKYLMTHLGSYKDLGQKKGFAKLVDGLDKTLDGYSGKTKFLIEIAAGAGDIIGEKFEDIGQIIDHKKLQKYDIGVCYDTQHAFASGYDIRTAEMVEDTLSEFENMIGLEKLKMSHINDSKVELGSKRDRHEHLGKGFIGKKGFEYLLSHKKLSKINFVLETKHDEVKKDLAFLKKLRS